jgi:hypothetical protein
VVQDRTLVVSRQDAADPGPMSAAHDDQIGISSLGDIV